MTTDYIDHQALVRAAYPEATCEWSHDHDLFEINDGNGGHLGAGTPESAAWEDAWTTHMAIACMVAQRDVPGALVELGVDLSDMLDADAQAAGVPRANHAEKLLLAVLTERRRTRATLAFPAVGTKDQCGKSRCKKHSSWRATPHNTDKRIPVIYACHGHLLDMLHGRYDYRLRYL